MNVKKEKKVSERAAFLCTAVVVVVVVMNFM